jgi:hypothetical protein
MSLIAMSSDIVNAPVESSLATCENKVRSVLYRGQGDNATTRLELEQVLDNPKCLEARVEYVLV